MSLKNIAVFVDEPPAGSVHADYATRLALQSRAHLVGIFVTPSEWPRASYIRGHDAIAQLIEEQRAKEVWSAASASERFTSVAEHEGISFEFRTIRPSDIADDAFFHSLHADLVIVAHPKPGGLPEYWLAESMLLATGVPALILPGCWSTGRIAENIVVAWNATREARRAITDAMPLLQKARTVSVIVVDAHTNARQIARQTPACLLSRFNEPRESCPIPSR